jgi:hypothetical protein
MLVPRFAAAAALAGIALGLAGRPAPAVAGAAPAPPTPTAPTEERIAQLEARVAELEAFLAAALGFGAEPAGGPVASGPLVLPVVVTRKHFQGKDPAHGRWEDWLDFDVEYETALLEKPATAIRGTLVFSDSFGKERFEMPTEITDAIEPGRKVRQKGLRFKYNQFRDEHQWMNSTDTAKMQVALRISTVMFRDGSTAAYR